MTLTKLTKNTGRYEVPEAQFGVDMQSSVYVTHTALLRVFGKVPAKIRITVEAEE